MGSVPGADAPTVKVFIAGGSYCGLSAAVNLLDLGQGLSPRMAQNPYNHHPELPRVNWDITIADERDGFYHLIGSPLALADSDYAKKAWVKFQDLPGLQSLQVKFVHGTVSGVDCQAKKALTVDKATKETTTHAYDYFLAATGLRRAWPVVPQSLTRKQYLVEVDEHVHAVTNARHGVVVVGGGAVGIEMAAELKLTQPSAQVTLVHSREKLLSSEGLSDECKDKALELLKEAGVDVIMNQRVVSSDKVETLDGSSKYEVKVTDGRRIFASQVIMALSNSVATSSYLPSSALDQDGYVKIEANLRFVPGTPNHEYHFCSGDLARWSGIKRCGVAMHGGHYVAQNIHKSILKERFGQEPSFVEFQPVVQPMIGLAVGRKAIASGPDGTTFGEDVLESCFRDDLGFTICWDWMGLGGRKQENLTA
ncbi:pyridine nucleotide-disulfide oxidoreductase [Hirsutella rhossiliensis]|uniref:Pyridine nucleotide-disulfide oxidoreductase domain-containing protein n=1 Tax=Hirsutella rhossiliensis TaxID=111463 RepID=A0A9P8N7K1_9HYPO|nr:pyridine nucleotide-disulfide oxidoreductase domain-containing protein [Hirsutella rhossiliensis]KAH0968290.1 pyridine nucleotide-disulfide oxidoreductase domain-containing protein [Hirsutella rhossiliensis]